MKAVPVEYYTTILDRLTRFEPAYIRYGRVFDDLISKFGSNLKIKDMSVKDKIQAVQDIFASELFNDKPDYITTVLTELEKKYFIYNEVSYQYLSCRLNISGLLSRIENSVKLPKNLFWLKNLSDNINLKNIRNEKSLLYPIEMLLLCEGETERIVLSTILKLLNCNLDKMGIMLIAAGGKNQVARKYYSMLDYIKLPCFILLDKDALEVKSFIDAKIRDIDSVYLINSGEFEDLIPENILINTLNFIHNTEIHCKSEDFDDNYSAVCNLENICKKYGFGEFKKAHFAQNLKEYIEKYCTKDDFIHSEISEIVKAIKTNYDNQTLNQANELAL